MADYFIRAISVTAFRGIPGSVELSLGGETPASLILLGDNGSGKSSVVDGLQFGLQGTVRGLKRKEALGAARNKSTPQIPAVEVDVAGRTVRRTFFIEENGSVKTNPPDPVPHFESTPLVLRRSEIQRFWDTPEESRQLVFISYFKPAADLVELPHEREARLRAERSVIKRQRREAIATLAEFTGQLADEIPLDASFDSWVDQTFYAGFDRQKVRVRRKVQPDIQAAIDCVNDSRRKIKKLDKAIRRSDSESSRTKGGASSLVAALEGVSETVTRGMNAISPDAPVESVEVSVGEASSVHLGVAVRLKGGRSADPRDVLSEANRDLLALLIFVAVAKAAWNLMGQAPVIVLDDVFQSVDAPIRLSAMSYLIDELPGWQFLITAHDRLWREQLTGLFHRRAVPIVGYEIVGWTFEQGPTIQSSGDAGSQDAATATGEPSLIVAQAGRTLEQICDVMSWTMGVSVRRKKDDRYTLGDLWPAVFKQLKRTSAAPTAQVVDDYLHLRNLLGAHYNEWAESASLAETKRLSDAVANLQSQIRCPECGRWVEKAPEKDTYSCRCGITRLTADSDRVNSV